MSSHRLVSLCLVAASLLVAGPGCGSKTPKKKAKKPAAAAAAAAATVEKLPEVDPDSAITVDGGRLAVASPKGWARGPRSKEYLVRYTPTAQKTYPSVSITAADPPEGCADVRAANHDAFVAAVAAALAGTFTQDGKSTLLEAPAPVTLGSHFGVTYTAPGQTKPGGPKEQLANTSFVLVVNGRMVTVEASGPKGKLADEARLAAKAVAIALAAPQAGGPAASFGTPAPAATEPAEPAAPAAAEAP